ncbi:DUF1700 domain-containing protein [Streptobacillus canis]|uniref:DUF1700 domain-containing protein n=1 Tax=Streptobacillus canis TaxID=2678686 RepID=UPI0012E1970E|nr:DUF1700 domain-containing protein [Streptobacillus canis]
MTKKEFMRKLDIYLKDLDYTDKKSVFDFYEEYFADLGIEDNDKIPTDMDPKIISRDILVELGIKKEEKWKRRGSFTSILLFLSGIITAPIAIPAIILVLVLIPLLFLFIIGVIAIPFIILWSLFTIPFKVIGLGSSFLVGSIGGLFILIGLAIIFIPIIISISKFIISIISDILMRIYRIISSKKKKKYSFTFKKGNTYFQEVESEDIFDEEIKEEIISLEGLKKIKFNDILGNVKIVRGNENNLKIMNFIDKIELIKVFNDGVLDLSIDSNKAVEILIEKLPTIVIEYKEENLDVEVDSLLGNIYYEYPKEGNLDIDSILGTLKVNLGEEKNIDISVDSKLGSLKIDDSIDKKLSSKKKIRIDSILGMVKIY